MADSMWDWFGDNSLNASASELFRSIGTMVTGDQMDPQEVAQRMVELTEAETTTENNFVPEALLELVSGVRLPDPALARSGRIPHRRARRRRPSGRVPR